MTNAKLFYIYTYLEYEFSLNLFAKTKEKIVSVVYYYVIVQTKVVERVMKR